MAWFRSRTTGREWSADGRWAEAYRQLSDVEELPERGAPSADPAEVTEADVAKVSKADLQAAARAAGLSDTGTKAELAERIRSASGEGS